MINSCIYILKAGYSYETYANALGGSSFKCDRCDCSSELVMIAFTFTLDSSLANVQETNDPPCSGFEEPDSEVRCREWSNKLRAESSRSYLRTVPSTFSEFENCLLRIYDDLDFNE